jgi:CRISPR-associated protein Cmr6
MMSQINKRNNFMLNSMHMVRNKYKEYLGSLSNNIDKRKKIKDDNDIRKKIKDEVIGSALSFDFSSSAKLASDYMDEVAQAYKSLGLGVVDVKASLSTKLVSGLASGFLQVIMEVGMHWDPILDLPYVPGSSIKGVMRSNALELCKMATDKEKCLRGVLEIFGSGEAFNEAKSIYNLGQFKTTASVGRVVVSNAYPVELSDGKLFEGDIVNPHYYKNNRIVKNEYEVKPVPVTSIAVRRGVKFRFIIGVKPFREVSEISRILFNNELKTPSEPILFLLAYSLSKGIGARTSKGYGYMDIDVKDIKIW